MNETFQTPPAPISDDSKLLTNGDKPWSPKGRFGRLSYLAWLFVVGSAIGATICVFFGIFAASGGFHSGQGHLGLIVGGIAGVILYIAMIYSSIIFGIRRLHDVNRTGWLMLIQLLPFAGGVLSALHIGAAFMMTSIVVSLVFGLYLIFAKGTDGANDFGAQRPTPQWEKVMGWVYIVMVFGLALVGGLAAISIPAYQSYVKKAHATEQSQTTFETAPAAQ